MQHVNSETIPVVVFVPPSRARTTLGRKVLAPSSPKALARLWTVLGLTTNVAWGTLLTGCSGDAHESASEAVVTSESGALLVTVSSEPEARPMRGNNRIFFSIELTATGEPVDDLELVMTPFMPAHGHGSSQKPSVHPLGDGHYRFDDVVLPMPGLWELRTTVSGPLTDFFAPRFEVE